MPKLNKTTAKKAADSGSSFEVFDAGVYMCKLLKVTVSDKPGKSGSHYWTWEVEIDDPEFAELNGRRGWLITSLSEKALFKMNETFAAFGAATDTDTDELIGNYALGTFSQEVQEEGQRKGQLQNRLEGLLPADDFDGE